MNPFILKLHIHGVRTMRRQKKKLKCLLKKIIALVMGNTFSFRVVRFFHRKKLIVLCYHRVVSEQDEQCLHESGMCVDARCFDAQMAFLSKHYHLVSEREVIDFFENNKKMPPYAAWVTFDDGYRDNYTNALPILKKYKVPATVFVTTGYINSAEATRDTLFMRWDDLYRLNKEGVAIGAHTVTHPKLSQLSDEEIAREIAASKDDIEQKLNTGVVSFAYPFGKSEHFPFKRCKRFLEDNNLKVAVSTIGGLNNIKQKESRLNLRRINLDYGDTVCLFRAKLASGSFWQR